MMQYQAHQDDDTWTVFDMDDVRGVRNRKREGDDRWFYAVDVLIDGRWVEVMETWSDHKAGEFFDGLMGSWRVATRGREDRMNLSGINR